MSQQRISYLIAQLDLMISEQVSEILRHDTVQALEASWRGLAELAAQASDKMQVRVLDCEFQEMEQDIRSKLEFDQTHFFDKIYSAEFGMPGGKPYSLLVGDYYFDIKNPRHILTLTGISQIAAAAFSPFISSIQFECLNIASYETLLKSSNTAKLELTNNYLAWQRFRRTDDACFVGFVLPKVLMSRRYNENTYANAFFQFKERGGNANSVWGHPGYLFALTVMHSFKQTSWFDDLNRTALDFVPAWKQMEYFLDHKTESILNHLGIIALVQRGYSHPVYCFNSFSLQQTKIYETERATVNAKIAAILKYIFCVSRFAHYVKIIAREKIGSFQSSIDLQNYLNHWIGQYVAANEVPEKIRPIYPLKNAQVTVMDKPGNNTLYQCIMRLMPRLDLESANVSLQLVTVLGKN